MKHWLSYLKLPMVGNPSELQAEVRYLESDLADMYRALRTKEREMLGLIAQIDRTEQDLLKDLPKRGITSTNIAKAKVAWVAPHASRGFGAERASPEYGRGAGNCA